jgi:hypothetical protein
MKVLVYTFRTFPHIQELKEIFPEVFVLGKLKEDLLIFLSKVKKLEPDLILGIAHNEKKSQFEPIAVNRFNNKQVIREGKEQFELFVPNSRNFNISQKPSTSFCNYSMYWIKYHLNQEKIIIPFSFIHINKKEILRISANFR